MNQVNDNENLSTGTHSNEDDVQTGSTTGTTAANQGTTDLGADSTGSGRIAGTTAATQSASGTASKHTVAGSDLDGQVG